jgi:putative endonuclease
MSWCVYLVRCRDDSLYVGITNDLDRRIAAHNAGKGAKYTRSRKPVALAFVRRVRSATTARRLEVACKRLDRRRRLLLVDGDRRVLRQVLRDAQDMARKARSDA